MFDEATALLQFLCSLSFLFNSTKQTLQGHGVPLLFKRHQEWPVKQKGHCSAVFIQPWWPYRVWRAGAIHCMKSSHSQLWWWTRICILGADPGKGLGHREGGVLSDDIPHSEGHSHFLTDWLWRHFLDVALEPVHQEQWRDGVFSLFYYILSLP